MRIRLLSDLHHEFQRDTYIQTYFEYAGEDVLVLAGDIASGSTNVYDVIKRFKHAGFKNIVYVPGNHEYYGTDIRDFDAKMTLRAEKDEALHFLNPGFTIINDVVFVGGALWTDFRGDANAMDSAEYFITDFRLIKSFSPERAVLMFNQHIKFIESICKMFPSNKKVVVTHFLPAIECISPRFANSGSLLNNYFANNLSEFIETLDNTTWMFGHTHDSIDLNIGSTRLICNPYGYHNREANYEFDPRKTIEI